MRILVCPGQGSQSPGFLQPWLEALPGLRSILEAYSAAAGVDLIEMGTTADESTIKDTAIAQPLIVGASLAVARATAIDKTMDGFAGHSVGEFAAAALAGVISDTDAMRLVGVRARAMALAASKTPTGMVAVIGQDEQLIVGAVAGANLTIANFNGGGQFVAAGPIESIEQLASNPPERIRVVPLKVAGAFHTEFMSEAVASLREAASEVTAHNPEKKLWSNFDGQIVTEGSLALNSLVAQVSRPVRWDSCMQSFTNAGVTLIVELPPAGALTGLVKRGVPGALGLALKTPADLERA